MIAKICGVYKILNTITGDYYLGSSCDIRGRWNSHRYELRKNLRGNTHFQNAWNKYGEQAFEFSILLLCDVAHKLYLEDGLIKLLRPAYNSSEDALAPMQGRHHTAESLAKMSGKNHHNFGKHHTEESKQKIGKANMGKHHTEESKQKIREVNIGKYHTEESKQKISESGKGNTNALGHIVSEKVRARLSEASKGNTNALGHKYTEEVLAKMRGRIASDKTREKMSIAAKKRWALKREAQND